MASTNNLFDHHPILKGPWILAPMAGVTDQAFRCLMKNRGADLVISELVSADGLFFGGQKTLDLSRFDPKIERPFGLQIFGDDIEKMVFAAKKAESMEVDFIDINLGCPVKKVVKRGAGSALLKDPLKLSQMISAMMSEISIPLTIKIRTGWDDSSINAKEICQMAESEGVSMVSIHGRTRTQAYEGLANWDIIGEAASAVKIPVIGNGDVVSAENAISRYRDYPVAGVMIGRGCLKNPFLFQEIQALERGDSIESVSHDYLDLCDEQIKFLEEIYQGKRERLVFLLLRKFLGWYSAGFPEGSLLRRKLFQVNETDDLMNLARDFFNRIHWWQRLPLDRFLMGGHG